VASDALPSTEITAISSHLFIYIQRGASIVLIFCFISILPLEIVVYSMEGLFINCLLDVYIFTTLTRTLKQVYAAIRLLTFHVNCGFGFHLLILFVIKLISLYFVPFMLTFYVTVVRTVPFTYLMLGAGCVANGTLILLVSLDFCAHQAIFCCIYVVPVL